MPLYYANEPLLLEDILTGEAKGWLDRFLAYEEANLFGQPTVFNSEIGSRSGCPEPVGLPMPNYPDPPPPKLNTLYWPTGAVRWARFVGLADLTTKNRILESVLSQSGEVQPASLVVSANRINNAAPDSFTLGTLATKMYLLPPRPVSELPQVRTEPTQETLWLIPLVDIRYYWQFRHTGSFEPSTWAAALTSLGNSLGLGITASAISAAYDIPSPAEHWRSYANAAYMLDAVAWSVGHRITRSITGEVFSASVSDAIDRADANLSGEWGQVAGGVITPGNHLAGLIPEKVIVTFRDSDGIEQAVEEVATDHGHTGYVPDLAKIIHTNFPYDADDPTEAEALATQIASDFFFWKTRNYDRSFVGVKPWVPSGFDDYVEWSIGRRRADGTYEAHTRVQTFPYNFGVDEQPVTGTACENELFEGYLCQDLSAAESTMSGPTAAIAIQLIKDSIGNLTHGSEVVIYNRDTTLTLEAWTYIVWAKVNGENRIVWAACRGDVSSSCSGVDPL